MEVKALGDAPSGALLPTGVPLGVVTSVVAVLALVLPGLGHGRDSLGAVLAPDLGRLLLRGLI